MSTIQQRPADHSASMAAQLAGPAWCPCEALEGSARQAVSLLTLCAHEPALPCSSITCCKESSAAHSPRTTAARVPQAPGRAHVPRSLHGSSQPGSPDGSAQVTGASGLCWSQILQRCAHDSALQPPHSLRAAATVLWTLPCVRSHPSLSAAAATLRPAGFCSSSSSFKPLARQELCPAGNPHFSRSLARSERPGWQVIEAGANKAPDVSHSAGWPQGLELRPQLDDW